MNDAEIIRWALTVVGGGYVFGWLWWAAEHHRRPLVQTAVLDEIRRGSGSTRALLERLRHRAWQLDIDDLYHVLDDLRQRGRIDVDHEGGTTYWRAK